MATFSSMQSRVQAELVDTNTSVQSFIPTWINAAIWMLEGLHNFQIMQAEAAYTTPAVSNTTPTHILGQIPTDWKCKREDPYFVMFIGTPVRLGWIATRPATYTKWETQDINQIGQPRDLLLGEPENSSFPDPANPDNSLTSLNIEFFPYSDGASDWSDGNYRIRLPYFRYLPALVNGTDQNWFTLDGPRAEFCVRYAVAQGFLFNEDEMRAQLHGAMAVGKQFDGSNETSLGGWARQVIDMDKRIMMMPGNNLRFRRDVFGSVDQRRT